MDTSPPNSANATSHFRRIAVRAAIILVAVTAVWFLFVGRGALGYFSPYTLEVQGQSERTIFFGEIPIYRSPRQTHGNRLVEYLVENDFVAPVESEQQRWDLVYHWNHSWYGGHGMLYNILVRNSHSLIEWSKAHPEHAKLFWREFFKGLRSEYEFEHEIAFSIANRYRFCKSLDELRFEIFQIRCWEVFLMAARIEGGRPATGGEREYLSCEVDRLRSDPLMKTFLRKQAKQQRQQKCQGPMASNAAPLAHRSA
jgi:hypothetical protein